MTTAASGPAQGIPVSADRVCGCLESASFWVDELPRYADRQQRRADAWAIASGILGAITSLSIWPVFAQQPDSSTKVTVAAVALVAAIFALVPRVKNYGELAGQARELSSRYGALKGQLIDLRAMQPLDQHLAHIVVEEFQATKEKKDSLRGLPDRTKIEIKSAQTRGRLAKARENAAEAEKRAVHAETGAAMPKRGMHTQ